MPKNKDLTNSSDYHSFVVKIIEPEFDLTKKEYENYE